ncbi:MAG: hypothetical protein QOG77_915, partial [Solirubrobacteraceae bacterium]|nr:hypothetical protein [Solirubrobacteraceae bacterium]
MLLVILLLLVSAALVGVVTVG